MSAFIVNDETIALLVEALFKYDLTILDGSITGQQLLDQNYRSVNYRYGESTLVPEYKHKGTQGILLNDPYTVYKVARCYDYQCCEHPGYPASWACLRIEELLAAIERELGMRYSQFKDSAAYDEAPWGL